METALYAAEQTQEIGIGGGIALGAFCIACALMVAALFKWG